MPSLITKNFRIHNAEQFLESFQESSPTIYYLFIGKATPFANDAAPTQPEDFISKVEYDYFRDMISLKRIQPSDVSHVVIRYNWTSGNIYKPYNPNQSLYPSEVDPSSANTFYVLTDEDNVYKCIDNNGGAASTVKPTGTTTSITETSDGYRWKFLYKISASDALKFLTSNFMPVQTLTANNGSAQWAVQQSAANGSIERIVVTANGSGFLSTSNTFAGIVNNSVVTLKSNASGTDDIYNNSTIFISNGLGAGQLRKIVNYVGGSRTLTVNTSFITTPNTSSTYIIGPNVIIRGDSGLAIPQRATAYVSNCAGGQIRTVRMISPGRNYSQANVSFTANSAHGTGAIGMPTISHPGGDGSNPVHELGSSDIAISVRVTGSEANTFPTNNEFRMIGILADPKLRGGQAANASVIDQCARLNLTGVNGDFIADEVIRGDISGCRARLVIASNTNLSGTNSLLKVNRLSSTGLGKYFQPGETVTGLTSGRIGTVANVNLPVVREYTGSILYVENRTPISRTPTQIEDFKIIIRF